MNLLDARPKMAALLAPVEDDDPYVLTSLVDALEPPVLMVGWGEPKEEPYTTPCFTVGRIIVTCVASRLVPGEGQATLEWLNRYVHQHVEGVDPANWTFEGTTGDRVFLIGKTSYLANRMTYKVMLDA